MTREEIKKEILDEQVYINPFKARDYMKFLIEEGDRLEQRVKELTKPDFDYWYEENQQSLLRVRILESRLKKLQGAIGELIAYGVPKHIEESLCELLEREGKNGR